MYVESRWKVITRKPIIASNRNWSLTRSRSEVEYLKEKPMRLDFDQFDKAYNEDIEANIGGKKKAGATKQRQRIQGYLIWNDYASCLCCRCRYYQRMSMNRIKYGNARLQAEISLQAEIDVLEHSLKDECHGDTRLCQRTRHDTSEQAQHRHVQRANLTLKRNTESAIVMEGHESFPAQANKVFNERHMNLKGNIKIYLALFLIVLFSVYRKFSTAVFNIRN